jgi:HlyD family secretion protein
MKRRRIIPVVIILALAAGGYYWWQQRGNSGSGLTATGTIEATSVSVSAEVSGRVVQVNVAEGQQVTSGSVLIQFDDALLKAQRRQAEANFAAAQGALGAAKAAQAAAQAQLDMAKAGSRSQEVQAQQSAVDAAAGRVSTAQAQLNQARGALQASTAARNQATARFAQVKDGAKAEVLEQALVAYQQAAAAVRLAQSEYDKIAYVPNIGATPQALALEKATLTQEAAKANYEALLKGATTPELDQARAGVDQAAAGIIQASAAVSQTDAALVTARASLGAEQARLSLLQAGSRPEQIAAASAQLDAAAAQVAAATGQAAAAQAALGVIDEQMGRLTLRSPLDAWVLSRAVEPAEVALPGAPLLVLGDLAHLTVTVYLGEDRYGQVKVGDQAAVTVDSFSGQRFSGTVQRIADKAEFTPRNVQTVTGRRTTVFAVKVAIDDPQRQLKPGMPADVHF